MRPGHRRHGPHPAGTNALITVDKTSRQMTAAVDGTTRWHWPVSLARPA
jgi:hypothetical protein